MCLSLFLIAYMRIVKLIQKERMFVFYLFQIYGLSKFLLNDFHFLKINFVKVFWVKSCFGEFVSLNSDNKYFSWGNRIKIFRIIGVEMTSTWANLFPSYDKNCTGDLMICSMYFTRDQIFIFWDFFPFLYRWMIVYQNITK